MAWTLAGHVEPQCFGSCSVHDGVTMLQGQMSTWLSRGCWQECALQDRYK